MALNGDMARPLWGSKVSQWLQEAVVGLSSYVACVDCQLFDTKEVLDAWRQSPRGA